MKSPKGYVYILGAAGLFFPAVFPFLAQQHAGRDLTKIGVQEQIPGFPEPGLDSMNHGGEATPEMRDHGWKLLLHLTRPGETQAWELWPKKCDLSLSSLCNEAPPNMKTDPAFPGSSPQIEDVSDKQERLSTVFYSPDAARFIEDHRLSTGTGLQDYVLKDIDIPPFPKTAIVVKEIWEGISVDNNDVPNEITTSLALYDPDQILAGVNGGLSHVSRWSSITKIRVDAQGRIDHSACDPEADFDLGPGHSVPLSCFYTRHYPGHCLEIGVQPNMVSAVPDSAQSCYLILVGLQIMTHEIENWTWTAFWWTNKPHSERSKANFAGQPSGLDPRFRHYAMDTTFGPPKGSSQPLPHVFNPYLEGPRVKGTWSNCFGCHNQAAYVPSCRAGACPEYKTGSAVNADGTPPKPCQLQQGQDRVAAKCPLKTSRLFSLSSNQDPGAGATLILKLKNPITWDSTIRH